MGCVNCVVEVSQIKFIAVSHTLERGGQGESSTCMAVKEICQVKATFAFFVVLFCPQPLLSNFANFTIYICYHPEIHSSGILTFFFHSGPAQVDLCNLKLKWFLSFPPPVNRSLPRELLRDGSGEGPRRPSGFPPVHLQRAGHSAAGHRTGPLSRLPVRGPEREAGPRGLPAVQRHQPGWWQVSNRQQPACDWLRWHDWVDVLVSGSISCALRCLCSACAKCLGGFFSSFFWPGFPAGGIALPSPFPRRTWRCWWTARRRWPVLCPAATTRTWTPMASPCLERVSSTRRFSRWVLWSEAQGPNCGWQAQLGPWGSAESQPELASHC